jgi:dTDP-4-amino-4,6-dideoxygalactose transaminase
VEGVDTNNVIRLSKSCISDAEKQAVIRVLDSELFGMGVEVKKFEQLLTEFFGRPAVCVSTGTAALHLALQATGIGPGDEVLVQSLTYIASFQAISATGATPVACDVVPETLCLDWQDAERRLTSNTKAIMPVHYSGGVGELNNIYAFAEKYGLRVIEDAAHAFGSDYQSQRIGNFGDIACFSFDGIKNITSGEGGCLVTDDEKILQLVRDARLLGVERDSEARFEGRRSWHFDINEQGWRYHMSNLMAAIGCVQLERFPLLAQCRKMLMNHYHEAFIDHPRIIPILKQGDDVVPHIYVVRIKGLKNRSGLRRHLLELGIETGVHYPPNHKHTLYRQPDQLPLPVTEESFPELLTLPLHPDMSNDDVDKIVADLVKILPDYVTSQ